MSSADLFWDKWTLLLLREMFMGTSRFSRFQRAIPRMSPSILSKRLRMLETAEIIVRKSTPSGRAAEYKLTRSGRELGPIIESVAIWRLRWRSRNIVARDCDVGGFMWDFHRTLNSKFLPDGETVILVQITDREDLGSWWMIVNEGVVDLCPEDPGHDVDVYITAALCDLIALWMGDIGIQEAMEARAIFVDGPKYLVNTVQDWIARSPMVDVLPA